ncbi:hypothetical protein HPB51_025125 [Rhipicephalus microplus]|uniref:Uncharacterized protein n=1 Tax=Rhipicephalus microplus TaxID=6941 RepID=A0A9J6DRK8_RHIMP|nr:hypothetical protein HPB51_025125 [Rhipicephalus microplus]
MRASDGRGAREGGAKMRKMLGRMGSSDAPARGRARRASAARRLPLPVLPPPSRRGVPLRPCLLEPSCDVSLLAHFDECATLRSSVRAASPTLGEWPRRFAQGKKERNAPRFCWPNMCAVVACLLARAAGIACVPMAGEERRRRRGAVSGHRVLLAAFLSSHSRQRLSSLAVSHPAAEMSLRRVREKEGIKK